MKLSPFQCANPDQLDSMRLGGWARAAALALALALPCGAQVAARPAKPAQAPEAAQDELEVRAAAAERARASGDLAAVESANRLVIASALRGMAELRMVQGEIPKAIELYSTSLRYEDVASTYADLAFAESQGGDADKAIEYGQHALALDPGSQRLNRMVARSLWQKDKFAEAVTPFSRMAQANPSVNNLYDLAACLLADKKPEDKAKAAAVFEQMKKTMGDSGSLHVLMGRAYRDADDIQTALSEFKRAIAFDPHTIHAHFFLGLALLVSNEWKPTPEAEAALRKEAEYFPKDYLANYMLGLLLEEEHRYEESDKYMLLASKINPASPDSFLYMGLNAYAQGQTVRAEPMLRKAVELTGKDEAQNSYQIRRAYVDLSQILFKSGHTEESAVFAAKARALQNKVLEENQQSISALMVLGGTGTAAAVMPLSGQQEDQSAPAAESGGDSSVFAKLNPEQLAAVEAREKALRSVAALAFNDLATSQAMRGAYSLALVSYQEAEKWDPLLPGLEKNLGLCAFRAKDYAEAIRGLSQALPLEAGSSGLRGMLGISYFATDQFAEAARTFAPLGSSGMGDSEIGYAWAASLAHIGDMSKATEVLTAFEAEPRSNETLLLIGQLWTAIGDYARANATLQRALQSDPTLLKAHFYMGLADIRWEHWAEAQKEFQAELSLDAGNAVARYHLGFVYLQQSKIDEAKALFLQVVSEDPDYPNAQYQLGKILLDGGQLDEAAGHLEAAARLSPQTDYIHYQLQAAYRKLGRIADADRELEIYKGLKAKSRESAADKLKQNP
jgi:tetratricopeptide (TPR) repeat protein